MQRDGRQGEVRRKPAESCRRLAPRRSACPALDAPAVAERFGREKGGPLYQDAQTHLQIRQQDTTLAGIRGGLNWLRESLRVRPKQVDTVVVFLSGHGYTTTEGLYYFATCEFGPTQPEKTGLSGKELREALGDKLQQPKRVFLFVDTCHSGGLLGRNSALSHDVADHDDVFFLASSDAPQLSYESEKRWGHGAFTLALLSSLARKDLEISGSIRSSELIGPVRFGVVHLMQEAGHLENPQVPVVRGPEWHMDGPVATARQ